MDTSQAFALALDPSLIFQAMGLAADPWQQELLLSTDRQVLLNCSRQAGKSRTVSALTLHTALFTPNSLSLILSPSQRQSAEIFRKVMEGYNALRRPIKATYETQLKLELENGSRIVCLPGREETIRSFGGVALLVIDEAARVSDDLYRSVRPMLAISQGRLIALTTPFGQRGWFYREWDGDGAWKRVKITWDKCPRITPEFIAQEMQSLGENWVRQEYRCEFTALECLGAGCPCLAGVEATLTYNPITNRWEGVTPDACAGNFDLSIILECDPGSCGPGNGCEGWKLTVTFEGQGTVADQCVDAGCSCAPLELTFTGIVFTDQRAECDRGVQIGDGVSIAPAPRERFRVAKPSGEV